MFHSFLQWYAYVCIIYGSSGIHFLQGNDLPFSKLKSLIEDPAVQVRLEVLRKFMKIISNLEDGSVSFLYELFHSIIDFKSSQVIILRKKVEKNSPFGKFLRMVLMNVRRMSYPQVHYLYRQLCTYVGEFVRSRKKSVAIIPAEQILRTPSSSSATTTPTSSSAVKDDSSSSGTPNSSLIAPITVLQDVWPSSVGSSKPFKASTKPSQQPNPYKFRGLEIFQRMIDRGRKNSSGLDYFTQYTTVCNWQMEFGPRTGFAKITWGEEETCCTSHWSTKVIEKFVAAQPSAKNRLPSVSG